MEYRKHEARFKALSTEKRRRLLEVGLKAFSVLSEQWKLTIAQKRFVLALDETEFESIIVNGNYPLVAGPLEIKLLTRLSWLLGVQKGIEINYPQHYWSDSLFAQNRQFDGLSLMQIILSDEEGLLTVKKYLQSMSEPGFL